MPKLKKYLTAPIFSIVCLKDCILVSSGGGGSRVGLKNSIQIYTPSPVLKDPFFTLDLADDIVEKLRYSLDCNLLVGNASEKCVVYQYRNKELVEKCRFQSDFKKKEPYQNDAMINSQGDTIATGGDEGVIRLWSYVEGEVQQIHEFNEEPSPVTSLDIQKSQPFLISTHEDKSLRFYNYQTKELLQKMVLDPNKLNLRFQTANFTTAKNQFYTITNPMRGASFLTFWYIRPDMGFVPLVTHKANDHPITASCVSNNGQYIGLGGADGLVKIFDTLSGEFQSQALIHDMAVKGLSFTWESRNLLSGSPDFTYDFVPNERPGTWFGTLSKWWFLMVLILFMIQLFMSMLE